MSNDLVKRLRAACVLHPVYGKCTTTAVEYDDLKEAADRIEALEAKLKAAYANCCEEVEKVKTDPLTELAKHQVIQNSIITARDWMIAMAEDIDKAIKAKMAV